MTSHTSITAAAVMSTATSAVNSVTAKVYATPSVTAARSKSTSIACLNRLWCMISIGVVVGFLATVMA